MRIYLCQFCLFMQIGLFLNAYSQNNVESSLIYDYHNEPLIYCNAYLILSVNAENSSQIEGYISPDKSLFSSTSYLSKISSPLKVRTKYFKLESYKNKSCGSFVRENDFFYFTFNDSESHLKIDNDIGRYYLAKGDLYQPGYSNFLFSLVLKNKNSSSGSSFYLLNYSNYLQCSNFGKCEFSDNIIEAANINFIQLNVFDYQRP